MGGVGGSSSKMRNVVSSLWFHREVKRKDLTSIRKDLASNLTDQEIVEAKALV